MNIQVFRKTKFVHFSIIIAATVCLYGNTFNLGFFSDDFLGIARYEKMGFGGLSNNYDNPFYMPFSFLFQALEISLTKSYLVIKTINLSLFISTAILIYSLTSRVFTLTKTSENTGRTALIITLLFVCSPYQTEAVNWFSSQAYLLSTFFAILGLHFLLKNSKRKNTGFYYYFLFLFLALLNKEISLILPIIAFLLRFLQTKDERVKFQHFVLGTFWFS